MGRRLSSTMSDAITRVFTCEGEGRAGERSRVHPRELLPVVVVLEVSFLERLGFLIRGRLAVTSTARRRAALSGAMEEDPHCVEGIIVDKRGEGRSLGLGELLLAHAPFAIGRRCDKRRAACGAGGVLRDARDANQGG